MTLLKLSTSFSHHLLNYHRFLNLSKEFTLFNVLIYKWEIMIMEFLVENSPSYHSMPKISFLYYLLPIVSSILMYKSGKGQFVLPEHFITSKFCSTLIHHDSASCGSPKPLKLVTIKLLTCSIMFALLACA